MPIRVAWILAFSLIALMCVGCDEDSNDVLFGASDQMLKSLFIGDVPVRGGESVNVPLALTSVLRFETSRPVTATNLETTLDYEIRIVNIDKGETTLLTDGNLKENGSLAWTDTSYRRFEYRMWHDMSYVITGGQNHSMGSVGDRFRITVDFLQGQSQDGRNFALTGDEFYVVWTKTATAP